MVYLQPPVRRPHRSTVILSKAARKALLTERQAKQHLFRKDLESAWAELDNSAVKIASQHHKTVQRVQHDLHFSYHKYSRRRTKVSAWNAFFWKKSRENRTTGMFFLLWFNSDTDYQ